MKNRLEAELVSIAHRVLKLKGKSDVIQLQKETLNLYEKLSVLRFVEENSDDVMVNVPEDIFEKLEQKQIHKEANIAEEKEPEAVTVSADLEEPKQSDKEVVEEKSELEEVREQINEVEEQKNVIEDVYEKEAEESLVSDGTVRTLFDEISEDQQLQNQFEDFETQLSEVKATKPSTYMIPIIFEELTPDDEPKKEKPITPVITELFSDVEKEVVPSQPKVMRTVSINDAVKKNFNIGLNDRIAFEFHLFNGDKEGFERTIAHLDLYTTFDEARNYIEQIVKPNYQYWDNKAEYESRFLEVIESKFL